MSYEHSEVFNGYRVYVSLSRGGTVGKRAAGTWVGEARAPDGSLFAQGEYTSPSLNTHRSAAKRLAQKFGIVEPASKRSAP